MLMYELSRRPPEHRMAGHHLPEGDTKGVQIRTDVNAHSRGLLGARKLRRSSKDSRRRNCRVRNGFAYPLGQPKVDNLYCYAVPVLQTHHNVSRLNIPVDELLFVYCSKPASDLGGNFQRQLYLQPAGTFDQVLKRFSLHKLHRVEVTLAGSTKVEDRGNIRMSHLCGCARFTQKTKSCRLVAHIFFADNLQRHR